MIASAAALILAPSQSAAQEFDVSLDIRVEGIDGAAFTSHCSRRLRALGDVTLSDRAGDWMIFLSVLPAGLTNRPIGGYAAAWVIGNAYRPGSRSFDEATARLDLTEPQRYVLALTPVIELVDFGIVTVPLADGADVICETLVTNFDANQLEPVRRSSR